LYAVPSIAAGSVAPVIAGAAATVIVTVPVTELCFTEVAVIVAVPAVVAVNFTDVVVCPLKFVPVAQAVPLQVQLTPAPLSLVVVAAIVALWPLSMESVLPWGKVKPTVPVLPPVPPEPEVPLLPVGLLLQPMNARTARKKRHNTTGRYESFISVPFATRNENLLTKLERYETA
jgi:hypothetical protein